MVNAETITKKNIKTGARYLPVTDSMGPRDLLTVAEELSAQASRGKHTRRPDRMQTLLDRANYCLEEAARRDGMAAWMKKDKV